MQFYLLQTRKAYLPLCTLCESISFRIRLQNFPLHSTWEFTTSLTTVEGSLQRARRLVLYPLFNAPYDIHSLSDWDHFTYPYSLHDGLQKGKPILGTCGLLFEFTCSTNIHTKISSATKVVSESSGTFRGSVYTYIHTPTPVLPYQNSVKCEYFWKGSCSAAALLLRTSTHGKVQNV